MYSGKGLQMINVGKRCKNRKIKIACVEKRIKYLGKQEGKKRRDRNYFIQGRIML